MTKLQGKKFTYKMILLYCVGVRHVNAFLHAAGDNMNEDTVSQN